MSSQITNIHDAFFKQVLGNQQAADTFLREHLPPRPRGFGAYRCFANYFRAHCSRTPINVSEDQGQIQYLQNWSLRQQDVHLLGEVRAASIFQRF